MSLLKSRSLLKKVEKKSQSQLLAMELLSGLHPKTLSGKKNKESWKPMLLRAVKHQQKVKRSEH
jgi:hypothetical protein